MLINNLDIFTAYHSERLGILKRVFGIYFPMGFNYPKIVNVRPTDTINVTQEVIDVGLVYDKRLGLEEFLLKIIKEHGSHHDANAFIMENIVYMYSGHMRVTNDMDNFLEVAYFNKSESRFDHQGQFRTDTVSNALRTTILLYSSIACIPIVSDIPCFALRLLNTDDSVAILRPKYTKPF